MFGPELKTWRQIRRMSQLDRAMGADVSARHISFLETGRSTPSRMMVNHLAETLNLPMAARNELLAKAGFAAAHGSRALDDDAMEPVRRAIEWTLSRHDPYPGLVMDRDWKIVALNQCATAMFNTLDLRVGDSLVDALFDPKVRDAVLNWPEVALHTVRRLRAEIAHYGEHPELKAAQERLMQTPEVLALETSAQLPPFVPAIYDAGGAKLSLFSTIAAFSSAEDIALADLRIELFFPADQESDALLSAIAGSIQ